MALRAALRKRFVSWKTCVSTCTSTQIACTLVIISHASHCRPVRDLLPHHADHTHLHRCVCLISMRQNAPINLGMRPCRTTREGIPTLDLLCPQQCPPTTLEPTSTRARPSSLAGVSLYCLSRAMSSLAASLVF